MKVSCLPVSLFRAIQEGEISIPEWISLAKDIGLNGIDLSIALIRDHTPVYLEKLKQDLQDQSMEIIMITAYPDFTHPSKLQREREEAYFIRDIAVSSYLGAKYLRMTSGQAHPEVSIKEGIGNTIECFDKMVGVAEKFGIKLLFENHTKPGAWKYPDFSMPFHIFSEITEKIKGTGIGINLDLGNLTVCGEDPLVVLEELYPWVETIHASDMKKKGVFEPTAVGEGVVPYREVFRFLKQKGFTKWVSIEEASYRGTQGIADATAYIRQLI